MKSIRLVLLARIRNQFSQGARFFRPAGVGIKGRRKERSG